MLRALCTVLAPVRSAKGFKATIPLAQEDIFLLAETRDSVLAKLQDDIVVTAHQQDSTSPKLIVLGSDISSVTGKCIVIYKTIEYTCPKITRGIDVFVKLRILLDLPYPPISKLVWMFIEQHVYGIKPVGGGYMVINKLIDHLEHKEK